MTDVVSNSVRSRMMAGIRGRDTLPEILVRKQLHAAGFRFRLHRRDLPGKPDIVLPRFRVAVFVHGCFWHQHKGCRLAAKPKSNAPFWSDKFERNAVRDRQNIARLFESGWRVAVIWECALGKAGLPAEALRKLTTWLETDAPQLMIG